MSKWSIHYKSARELSSLLSRRLFADLNINQNPSTYAINIQDIWRYRELAGEVGDENGCLLLFRFLLVLGFDVLGLHLAVQGFLSLAFRVGNEVLKFPCRDVLEEHLIDFLE